MENKIAGIRRDSLNLIISSKMKDRLNSRFSQTSSCSLCILRVLSDLALANSRSLRTQRTTTDTKKSGLTTTGRPSHTAIAHEAPGKPVHRSGSMQDHPG